METDDLKYKIAFASLKGMNAVMAREILARVGSERTFFTTPERALGAMMGFRNKTFEPDYLRTELEKAEAEVNFIKANNVRTIYYTDEDYPRRLAECDDAPLMIYGVGDCDLNAPHVVSIVGTRHATVYGVDFVDNLVKNLAERLTQPPVIVSGLAFGIDIAAHKAALKYGLPTVGVMATGMNTIYPARHRAVAAQMVRTGGMVLSDYRTSDFMHRANFLARNRIIAGLADVVVVAESAEKGGALVTAHIASGYNRDVFALPGRISDRYSVGCNRLISNNIGALITSADDLIKSMGWEAKSVEPVQKTLFEDLTEEETAVVEFLTKNGDATVNRLSVALNQKVGKMMSLLIDMEFKGLLKAFPGGSYRLS